MKVYLYPHYVSLDSASAHSPTLFGYLENVGLQIEPCRWAGTLQSLPTDPAFIRASSVMSCDFPQLIKRCAELGHFCFYDDVGFLPNGEIVKEIQLITEVEKFLSKVNVPT